MFSLDSILVKIALIGVLGIGAQWLAWRSGRPAIALMLVAGILAGPILGLLRPREDFGELLEPIVKLAVAVILFEGGLSLNFRDLRHAGAAVTRLVLIGVPLGWAMGTAACYYATGLPLSVSALFGGILVVTGPTVIGPMLRHLRVPSRVRDILKWEGIVNDPIGALLAVAIYAYVSYHGPRVDLAEVGFSVAGASFVAALIGAGLGFLLTWMFPRGLVPEYLKAPLLLITVIVGFVLADLVTQETGLITVTVMGIVMGNRPVYSSRALHRFKEDLSVLLVSGVFILLSATLNWATLAKFQASFLLFLLLLLFVVRPVTVLVSLFLSRVPWRERLFIAWIAPRGIVAIAITGLFSLRLVDLGYEGADALVPLVFGVVITTIVAHGFSAGWLARRLGIYLGEGRGVLILGANRWSIALARFLIDQGLDVMVSDPNKYQLRAARREGVPVWQGDLIDEAMGHDLDMGQFQQLIVMTDNDSYNQLVATDLGPEVGPEHIILVTPEVSDKARRAGRAHLLFGGQLDYDTLLSRAREGWQFRKTRITEKFGWDDYEDSLRAGEEPLALLKADGRLLAFAETSPTVEEGDAILAFVRPPSPQQRKAEHERKEAKAGAGAGERPNPGGGALPTGEKPAPA